LSFSLSQSRKNRDDIDTSDDTMAWYPKEKVQRPSL
jgi:hypothetical protein